MRVTDITRTKRQRYAIFIDGEFLFSAHEEALARTPLPIGEETTVETLEALRRESEWLDAREYAFRLLEHKSYTAHQLAEKLRTRAEAEIAEAVVARMIELGLVNDGDYALRCARDLYNLKHFSGRRIAQELRRRGVADCHIEEALAQFDEEAGEEKLYALVERKYLRQLGSEKGRTRTVNALVRLGYGYSEIKSVLRQIAEDYEIEEEP